MWKNIRGDIVDRLPVYGFRPPQTGRLFLRNINNQNIIPYPIIQARNRPLDDQDRAIMRALQKNARLSNAELAEIVGNADHCVLVQV
ncbi:hypothetical protein PTKU46_56520 [Paraburkholderia terrae]